MNAPWIAALAMVTVLAAAVSPASGADGPPDPAGTAPPGTRPADAARQAEVSRRGAQVMPFDLSLTTHFFTQTAEGGVQRVVAKDPADGAQAALIRDHLGDLRERFRHGDYSAPASIHGEDMPGLAELRAAAPGAMVIDYDEVPGGAELVYRSEDPALVAAVHRWFDAQLADHGNDARALHHPMHHHDHPADGDPPHRD